MISWHKIKILFNSLLAKLILSFLAFCCLSVVILFYVIEHSFESGLLNYINKRERTQIENLVEKLQDFYPESGDWQTIREDHRYWKLLLESTFFGRMLKRAQQGEHFSKRKGPPAGRPPPGSLFARIRLFDANRIWVAGPPTNTDDEVDEYKIEYQGEVVGWLIVEPARLIIGEIELDFKRNFKQWLILSMLVLFLLSALLAWLITRNFLIPVKRLTDGATRLSQGQYGQELSPDRSDELGQLVKEFNHLSFALQESQTTRERWMADIAHELRTPLTILQGEIQALIDGTREVKPESLASLMEEAKILTRLVDDLRDLTLSDIGGISYVFKRCDATEIIETVIESFYSQIQDRELNLIMNGNENSIMIKADYDRIVQLFNNILSNSIRYTERAGKIQVLLEQSENYFHCIIEDSTPGVSDESLLKLFDRLYRAEDSRNRNTGGSGLGLSIAQNIVTAHQGKILAEHSTLGGLKILVKLPLL